MLIVSVVLFAVVWQDYHWWWRSFVVSGGSAFYVFIYSIFYFVTKASVHLLYSIFYFVTKASIRLSLILHLLLCDHGKHPSLSYTASSTL